MKRTIQTVVAGVLAVAALAGCSSQLGDRGGVEGAAPDYIGDVQWIEVYRSADNFPNIARVCVLGLGFATPSTGRSDSGGGATPLLRVTEWDSFCASKSTAK